MSVGIIPTDIDIMHHMFGGVATKALSWAARNMAKALAAVDTI